MRRAEGSAGVKLIECISPARDKWRVRWDVQEHEDGSASYMEEEFGHRPTDEEIRATVIGWHNARTDERILSGFVWNGMPVWLSAENQMNYKAAHDLAVQSGGETLPVTFKFGTDDCPVYHVFCKQDDLRDFYTAAMRHIQTALEAGWREKDAFSLEDYRIE